MNVLVAASWWWCEGTSCSKTNVWIMRRVWLSCSNVLAAPSPFSRTPGAYSRSSVYTSAPASLQQSVCTGPAGRGCCHHACRRSCGRTALGSARASRLCRRASCYRWSRLHGRTGLPWMRSERALSWAGGVRWCSLSSLTAAAWCKLLPCGC